MKPPNCTCDFCGKKFYRSPSKIRSKVFCNSNCLGLSMLGHKQPIKLVSKRIETIKSKRQFSTCEFCGEEFYRCPSHLRAAKCSYCSIECRIAARKGTKLSTEICEKLSLAQGRGEKHHCWKGKNRGKYRYVICPEEFIQMAGTIGKVQYHRLVVAKHLGRCLRKKEVVHHIDKDKQNNDISNLALFKSQADHQRHHKTGKPFPVWSISNEND